MTAAQPLPAPTDGLALDRLTAALLTAAAAGLVPSCAGRPEWTDEDPEARAAAADQCVGCPVLLECAAAADEGNEWGVWAGLDRKGTTDALRRRRAATMNARPVTPGGKGVSKLRRLPSRSTTPAGDLLPPGIPPPSELNR